MTNKEYVARAWVAVPGFDARTLDAMIDEDGASSEPASAPVEESEPTGRGSVTNIMTGSHNEGVQAHTINGGVRFGSKRR